MATCPNGHESAATDFCDTCGMRVGAAPAPPASAGAAGQPPAGEAEGCPACGAPRSGKFCETCGLDFATGLAGPGSAASLAGVPSGPGSAASLAGAASGPESASLAGGPPGGNGGLPGGDPGLPGGDGGLAPGTWVAVVTADRAYFDAVVAAGGPDAGAIEFPAYCPVRRFALSGAEVHIGRRSVSRGLMPEIDLTGPPADPGISHMHAVLTVEPGGSWAVLDPGSANGTQVNGSDIPVGVKVALRDGDRICIGGWTVLRLARVQ